MARTVNDAKLGSRSAREKLAIRSKPYWRAIDPGLHLGYRKAKSGGRWVARWYEGAGRYKEVGIGIADDREDAGEHSEALGTVLTFAQAQAAARKKREETKIAAAGLDRIVPYTVGDALDDYLAAKATSKSHRDSKRRADALIRPALGSIALVDLTAARIRKWRDELAATGARIRTKKGQEPRLRAFDPEDHEAARRRQATANRTLTVLKAALNHAYAEEKIQTSAAWDRVEPFEGVDAARLRYLSQKEAERLVHACDLDFRPIVQAGLLTGARYSELARLKAVDFDAKSGTLHILASKSGKDRRVVLTDEGVALFKRFTAGRDREDLIFRKGDGTPWGYNHQIRPMADACKRARLRGVSFHTLRHTWASHTVMAGAELLIVAKNLGHSDTRMVEKHYGHLAPSYIAERIRATAPTFGFKPGNVTTLR